MSIIKVENLIFSYPSNAEPVFDNVSFQIDTDWKLGFVGRNGRGKTTFLNLLQGKYEYGGRIISSVEFDYFPFPVRDKTRRTEDILREISPAAEDWELMRELNYLDVDIETLYRPFETLSSGERTKTLLAALFLNDGRFLLIDEPTNHLDAQAREITAAYLRKKKSFILVSHDRSFLDGCVDHILSLNRSSIEVKSGNFSCFMTEFERQQEFERKQNDKLKTDIKRLQRSAERTAAWASAVEASKKGTLDSGLKPDRGYIGHKSAKMMKRAKAAEARREKAIEQKSELLKNTEFTGKLKLSPLDYRAETLVEFRAVSVCYDGTTPTRPATFTVKRGDRIALDGKNGCGKSSLIKLLCDHAVPHNGAVKIGSDLKVSYVPQDASFLRGSLTGLARQYGVDESLLKTILRKMGFSREQFEKNVSEYSDGQKKKTLLAASLCSSAHLYVWDEPLNYIDIYSRMQIEELIVEYRPTMLFVEHDKTFRDKIATEIVKL